jgi:hypothetical protein
VHLDRQAGDILEKVKRACAALYDRQSGHLYDGRH